MEALERRDEQLDALQEQLDAARAELAAISSKVRGTPGIVMDGQWSATRELRQPNIPGER
jgi:hypothetical protein